MLNWGFRCCINVIGDIYATALSQKKDNLELQDAHFTPFTHFYSGCIRMNEMNPDTNYFTFSSKQVKKQQRDIKITNNKKLPQIVNQSTINK